MNAITSKLLALALGLILLCSMFPPRRHATTGESAGRGFIFSPASLTRSIIHRDQNGFTFITVVVDGSRFAVECMFILSLSGISVMFVNWRRTVK
jgi:hypothetical protein